MGVWVVLEAGIRGITDVRVCALRARLCVCVCVCVYATEDHMNYTPCLCRDCREDSLALKRSEPLNMCICILYMLVFR
jgi:hypothetical protein